MKKRVYRISGVVLVIIGFVLILSSLQFTGFVIFEQIGISKNISSILGLIFVIVGIKNTE